MYFVMLVYNKLNAPTIKQLYDSQAMLNKLMSLFLESIFINLKHQFWASSEFYEFQTTNQKIV